MAYVPKVNYQQVEAGVQRAAQALAPEVVRIRYGFKSDWVGDPSIFFRIVLADKVAKRPNFSDVTLRVRDLLRDELDPDECGLHAYFNVRSMAGQDEIEEAAWA
jgi:hypothetical protein